MFAGKRFTAAFVLGLVLCAGAFAQDIMDQYFDGDLLSQQIRSYVTNVSNLMPDSTTLQNVWSYSPRTVGAFGGIGVNGSVTLLERKLASKIGEAAMQFGGSHMDLSQFPESIPFLPGIAVDLRGGGGFFDIGVTGMWIDDDMISEYAGVSFLGEGSHIAYRSIGIDLRYTLIRDGQSRLFNVITVPGGILPAVTLQAGYCFTWMQFSVIAGSTEKVNVDFRNDSIFAALQFSKQLPFLLTPYFGMKLIFSKTDSGFTWETHRPLIFRGDPYVSGAIYNSGVNEGDFYTYFQIYGGFGIELLKLPHLITVGGAYNVITEHFGINLSIRLLTKSK